MTLGPPAPLPLPPFLDRIKKRVWNLTDHPLGSSFYICSARLGFHQSLLPFITSTGSSALSKMFQSPKLSPKIRAELTVIMLALNEVKLRIRLDAPYLDMTFSHLYFVMFGLDDLIVILSVYVMT